MDSSRVGKIDSLFLRYDIQHNTKRLALCFANKLLNIMLTHV